MTVNITLNEISVKNGLEVLKLLESKEPLPPTPQSVPEPKDISCADARTNLVNPQAPAATVPIANTYAPVTAAAPTAPVAPVSTLPTAPVAPVTQAMPYQQTVPTQPVPFSAPTSVPPYTIEQFQAAIAPLLDAGKVQQIQQLVQSFGVATLMDIPKERYGEFANGLRGLGGVL